MRIVMLNGWSVSSPALDRFQEKFAAQDDGLDQVEFVVVDHHYGDELLSLFKQLDVLVDKDTVLMGWSLGGMLALKYLQFLKLETSVGSGKADRLKAVIILQAPPCFLKKEDWLYGVPFDEFHRLSESVADKQGAQLIRLFSYLLVTGSCFANQDRRFLKTRYTLEFLPDWPILEKGLSYLNELDLRDELAMIDVPVFGVFGANDALVSSQAMHYFKNHLPAFEAIMIDRMGHFPFGEHGQQVFDRIHFFLKSLPLQSKPASETFYDAD